eukprot:TRINITY_DN18881_c0_g1_i1.p1 TRINITY_DN18881_c0_g1~~TRINITY_DN18881_c0_g1_i1.p1  ORF type:complete len:311 (+),score=56.98 TRINITY_DN18881_c0_g1_i1:13-945(+)
MVAIRFAVSSFRLSPVQELEGDNGVQPSTTMRANTARYLMVAGDKASVGKSSVCIGLLHSLVKAGLPASDIAYIKPATQCMRVQPVSKYCEANGIAHAARSPLIFYSGFTQEFVNGEAGTSDELMSKIKKAISKVSDGKRLVVVDGVGFPTVGSIVGCSSAQIAAEIGASVIIVSPGLTGSLGTAVDSFSLNRAPFDVARIPVIGTVVSKCPQDRADMMQRCVSRWIDLQMTRAAPPAPFQLFGVIPHSDHIATLAQKIKDANPENSCQMATATTLAIDPAEGELIEALCSSFEHNVNAHAILAALDLSP